MEPFRRARRCWTGIVVWSLAAFLAAWPLLLAPAAAASALPPGPPTALSGHGGNGQVSLSWKAPAAGGVAVVLGYDVYQGTSPGGESALPANGAVLVKTTSYTVTGLTNGTEYYFTVKAVSAAGLTSAASGEVGVIPSADPGAPSGLAATAGHARVSLSWAAPASDGGSAITGYDVYDGTTPGFTDSEAAASVSGTSATVSGLSNGTTYYFRVTAVNAAGPGPASGTASATPVTAVTTVTAPGAPGALTASPGRGQVRLSWAAPASAGVGGYEVYQGTSPGGESAAPVNGTALVRATRYTVSGLTAGTTYYFTVAAVSRAGQHGKDSNQASATPLPSAGASPRASATISAPKPGEAAPGAPGAPAPPSGLSASASPDQVSLAWIAPASDGGSRITGYRVYQGTTRGFSSRTPVKSVTGTSVTLTGLADGTTYYYVVTAVNTRGKMSLPSGEVAATPARAARRVSEAVIISLAAVAVGATAGAVALALSLRRRRPGPRPPVAPPAAVPVVPGGHAVQAVPEPGGPAPVSIGETGPEEISAVRLETHPGTMITTIEETGP